MSWLENTIACSVTKHVWGNSKGVNAGVISEYSSELAGQAARKRMSFSKKLIECPEYEAILSFDRQIDAWTKSRSVQSMLKGGIYAVPTRYLNEWEAYLLQAVTERAALVPAFIVVYRDAVERARDELGALFNSLDYPSSRDVESKFSIEVRYINLTVPGRLQELAPDVFRAASDRLERMVIEGQEQIEAIMVAEVSELVQGLQAALTGLDDTKPKRFHRSHLDKIVQWSEIFLDIRNVTGFDGLETAVTQLRSIVSGQDLQDVKTMPMVRAELRSELQGTQAILQALMEDRPTRKMRD